MPYFATVDLFLEERRTAEKREKRKTMLKCLGFGFILRIFMIV